MASHDFFFENVPNLNILSISGKQLRVLSSVIRLGSMTAAAAEMNTSRPTVEALIPAREADHPSDEFTLLFESPEGQMVPPVEPAVEMAMAVIDVDQPGSPLNSTTICQ